MLIETGAEQPRTLAEAFRRPSAPRRAEAQAKINDYLQDIPLLAAGGAAAAAADQVAEWEMANHEQSIEIARTADYAWSSSGRRRCADRGAPAPPIIRAPGDHAFRLAAKDGAPIGAVRCTERMSEPENRRQCSAGKGLSRSLLNFG